MRKITILLLFFNYVAVGQNVTVTLHNKTGFDVDSLYFSGQKIGFAKKDTTITISNFKGLSRFRCHVFGVINGKQKDSNFHDVIGCTTGEEPIKEGKFYFDLLYFEREGLYGIYLKESLH